MPWTTSSEKEAARSRCLERIAYARRLVEAARSRSADLSAKTRDAVGGHALGDRIESHARFSVDSLGRAAQALSSAASSARSLDVTVWVDEDDGRGSDGDWR